MDQLLTPSLRAEPLMIVCGTFRGAQHIAHDLGLRRQEWYRVRSTIQTHGRRQGRYTICTHGHEWPPETLEVVDHLKDPTLGFQHLPHTRVRKLVVRDRAAEGE